MAEMTAKEYVEELVAKARVAQKTFERNCKTQRDVDAAARAIGLTMFNAKEEIAPEVVEETGMGTVAYKITKIVATTTSQWNMMRGKKSMGFIDNPRDEPGVRVIAKPIGVIGCLCPTTNPIITIICNGMQAVKCRNAIIICPHPKAKNVSKKCVDMIRAAFAEIGVPEDLMQIVAPERVSLEVTNDLLAACDANVATGGPGMVKSVYSCGKPGFGVGQGNTQEIICEDWDDLDKLTASVVNNRSWDLGVPCTSDQMLHIPQAMEADFLKYMDQNGAFIVDNEADRQKLRETIFPDGKAINRAVVGKTPQEVGKMAGIDVPEGKKIFLTKVEATGRDDVLCKEILFPFSRYRVYKDFEEAVDAAVTNLEMEGAGHNSAIWTHDRAKVDYAAEHLPVSRFHVNQNTLGSSNGLPPGTTLGCGYWSGNSISENLGWYHLMQTTRVSTVLSNKRAFRMEDWDDFSECPVLED